MIAAITEAITAGGSWIVTLFNSVVSLFWTVGEGGTGGELTFVGTLAIIAVGVGLLFGLINLVRSFMRMKG